MLTCIMHKQKSKIRSQNYTNTPKIYWNQYTDTAQIDDQALYCTVWAPT